MKIERAVPAGLGNGTGLDLALAPRWCTGTRSLAAAHTVNVVVEQAVELSGVRPVALSSFL